jgi:uncharacterized protein with HEPN domain
MPSKNAAQRLTDTVDNIDAIEQFIAGMEFDAFAVDRKTVYAVVRALEIISEATRRLAPNSRAVTLPSTGSPSLPPATSTVYRHEYEAVDERLIWRTARHDLVLLHRVAIVELVDLRD